MIPLLACAIAFLVTYSLARKSLAKGILAVLATGYGYGIFKAHFPGWEGFFIFDLSALGLYAAVLPGALKRRTSPAKKQLRDWLAVLTLFPLFLCFLPVQDYMVQFVGLRGNIFFLPFMILGAELTDPDLYDIGLGLAALNIAALVFAVGELVFGLQRFMPMNEVTYLIYNSHDVGTMDAYRIPATFITAHLYGGEMVMSLPFIIGTWSQRHAKGWHSPVLVSGILAAVLGVFLSATRTNFIALMVLALAFTFSVRLRSTQRVAWVMIVSVSAYLVSTHQRMQRFTTLDNKGVVTARIETSLNGSFLDALTKYPLGNGLGGGGTSLPYFLMDRANIPLVIESEYARIQLELGFVGLVLWLTFLLWFFTRPKPGAGDPWRVGKRLGWTVCLINCGIAFVGIGMLTAIPITALMLLTFGWLAAPRTSSVPAPARHPAFVPKRIRPVSPERLLPAPLHPVSSGD